MVNMELKDFNDIKQKTWIRVEPPDDPFHSRQYKIVSNVEPLSEKEIEDYNKRTTGHAHHKAYVHAVINFTPEGWADPGYEAHFPEKVQYISTWDVKHAVVAKKVTKKTYRGTIKDLFERKKNYERR